MAIDRARAAALPDAMVVQTESVLAHLPGDQTPVDEWIHNHVAAFRAAPESGSNPPSISLSTVRA